MSGIDEVGIHLVGQFAGPEGARDIEVQTASPSSLAAVGQLLNELGEQGWELIAYDTTTHRGVFKRTKDVGKE
jgi:hypothetical protein